MSAPSVIGTFKQATGMSIGTGALIIVPGFLAVALPQATGIGVAVLVAWNVAPHLI
jgi:hypothetical protein